MESKTLFNPFPGLRPFEPDEDHLFFGREREIDELLRRLRGTRFLQVVGTSGTGKSSLVRSGLIPALQSGFMVQAGSNWRILIFRPGDDPIGNLAASLDAPDVLGTHGELATTNRVLVEATLRRSTLGIVQAVRHASIPPEDNLLIVVDQFEELFRFRRSGQHVNSRNEAAAFFKLLLEATKQEDIPIYVVLTMRSDFLGDCMEFPGLPEAVNAGLYLVPRMTRDELRSAITGPVAVGGGEIAQRLVLRLLNDLGEDHDQLPVLQHALMRTWNHWEANHEPAAPIDVADYEAIGTLKEALSLHAEEAYQEAGFDRGHQIIEKIFKALTDTFSDPRGVRRPTSVQELAAICQASKSEIITFVEIFRRSARSFLTPHVGVPLESRSIIDLSHESLMRCWTRLIAWADDERESATTYMRIAQAASWCEECAGGLWVDPQLEIALQWRRKNQPTAAWAERYDTNFALAMDFLDRGEKQRELEREKALRRKRVLQSLTFGLAVCFLIASLFAYQAYREGRRAKQNLSLAERAVDESLSSAGTTEAREAPGSPEMEQFRKELLDKAKVFYLNFIRQGKTQAIASDAALGHTRLGDINRLLDLRQDAIQEYKQAIDDFSALAETHANNPYYRQKLAYAHHWTAETLRIWLQADQKPSQYSASDAEREYNAALRIQQQLVAEYPSNPDYKQELARTYYNRGILRYYGKQYGLTEADFRQAIDLLKPLAAANVPSPDQKTGSQPKPAQDLARVYNDLGTFLMATRRDYPQAVALAQQAIDIHENLLKQDPLNPEYKQELGQFYTTMAAALFNERKPALAQQADHKSLDLLEEVAEPSSYLSLALARASSLHDMILQDESRMSSTYGRTVQEAGQQHPEFHVMFMNLGRSYGQIATEYLKIDDLPEAALAIEDMHRLMPRLSPPERVELMASYEQLRKELHDKQAKP